MASCGIIYWDEAFLYVSIPAGEQRIYQHGGAERQSSKHGRAHVPQIPWVGWLSSADPKAVCEWWGTNMQNLLRVKKLVYRVTQSHLGGLELAFPLHFTLFRLVPRSLTGSAPVEQGGLCTQPEAAACSCHPLRLEGWLAWPPLELSEQASERKQLSPNCSIIKFDLPG